MPVRPILSVLAVLIVASLATTSQAAIRSYDSSTNNGTPGDFVNVATNLCPPIQTSPGILTGRSVLVDDGTGTVTLDQLDVVVKTFIDLGPGQLVITFGPGAFIFIDSKRTQSTGGQTSTTSGIGAHGPSSTDPGQSTEWGILSGFTVSGRTFCLSSPVGICNNGPGPHGMTALPVLNSDTCDLGTWNFDSLGNFEIATPYINATNNGGLSNNSYLLRGAFVGASLPALPIVGFGALAAGLLAVGARALLGRR